MKYLKYFDKKINDIRREKSIVKFKRAMKPMTVDETVDFIFENCQEYLEYPVEIQRAINVEDIDYFYSEPVRRYSVDNSNFYTLLMDNLSKWKNYPKRKKSFICSLSETHIGGEDYYVIPLDGSKWGIAPNFDIFHSFKRTMSDFFETRNMPAIDTFFQRIESYALKHLKLKLSDTNYTLFRKQLKQFSDIIKDIDFNEEIGDTEYYHDLFYFKKFMIENHDKIIPTIIKIMDPVKNNFKLMSLPEIYKNIDELEESDDKFDTGNDKEIWTESPCVFVNFKVFKKLVEEIEKRNKKLVRVKVKKRIR